MTNMGHKMKNRVAPKHKLIFNTINKHFEALGNCERLIVTSSQPIHYLCPITV